MTWYKQAPLFAEYVPHFHDLRGSYLAQDNLGFATICKLLVNSLYGKFGQRGIQQKQIGTCDLTDITKEAVYSVGEDKYYWHIYLAGAIFKEWKEGESYHSFPAIAAHVTANARLYLSDLLFRIPKGHVFYLDTDSFIVDETGLSEISGLLHPTELGKLKVEHTSPWVVINAPKDYAMYRRVRLKGISPAAIRLSPARFRQEQLVRLAGMLKAGDVSAYLTRTVEKEQRRMIHSGIVAPDGWVRPFLLPSQAEAELPG